jgi:hypothetical protein
MTHTLEQLQRDVELAQEQAARDAIAEIGEDDLNFVRGWR